MEWLALVTGLALVEYMWCGARVGLARSKHEIEAPATTGHPLFERHYRVHQNTLEQLIVFLPSLWVFGTLLSAPIAAGLGIVFIIGRVIYTLAYVSDPKSRSVGFAIGYLATVVLLLGGLASAVMALV